jgi:hypothetical protein
VFDAEIDPGIQYPEPSLLAVNVRFPDGEEVAVTEPRFLERLQHDLAATYACLLGQRDAELATAVADRRCDHLRAFPGGRTPPSQ